MTKRSQNFRCLFLNLKFLCQLGFYVIFILFANSASGASPRNVLERATVIVDLKDQGLVVGNYDTTAWSAQRFMQFRGVPYAASPTGALRFKAPVARPKWNEPVDATNWGRRCPVISTISTLSEAERAEDLEDCLNLCVYTKNLSGRAPVMMYVHGGGFTNGTSLNHPPKYLMEEDIVLVVPQYRLGALGFASSLTDEIPGNAGLADMLFALQWIQDHISTFGGDPSRVTIFGQSAGSAIVSALVVSPQIPDTSYFQNAIMQSGSILAQWAATPNPVEQAKRICKNLNCQNCENLQDTNACLMKADVSSLLEVTKSESIAPVIGDKLGMLPNSPAALFKNYNKSINTMIGFTKHDGSFILGEQYDAIFNLFGDAIKYLSVRQFIAETTNLFQDPSRLTNNLNTRLFFNRELLDGNNHTKALPSYFDLFNVLYFKSPAMAMTTELLQHSKNDAKVFLYSFDYEGQNTRFGYGMSTERYPFNGGVHHSDDNLYLFSTHALNEKDAKMSQKMVQLWTSFARDGVPKAEENVALQPMKSESGPIFHINEQIKLGYDAFDEFTSTMDDPNNYKLIRKRLSFL